jgi:lactate dehydrogenase-like 2-hydroxyacid dehydrogenase
VVVPHQGGRTFESLRAMAERSVENVDAVFSGKPVPYVIPELKTT